jgi:hypothetical protein
MNATVIAVDDSIDEEYLDLNLIKRVEYRVLES